ncbi:MAG: hypothetical protein ACOX45_08870 [Acutalibacteraceae bacterium]
MVIHSKPLETGDSDKEIINITEKLYVSWINEIYTSTDQYLGRTIKIEGMFAKEVSTPKNILLCFTGWVPVAAETTGLCVVLSLPQAVNIRRENDWIEVVGTLEVYEENGNKFLTLSNSKITVKQERGLEVVGNWRHLTGILKGSGCHRCPILPTNYPVFFS